MANSHGGRREPGGPGERRGGHADDGRETLTSARRLARNAQDELLAPLDDAERAQLHELLLRVVTASVESAPAGDAASAKPTPSSTQVVGSSKKSA
ncbi:MAG TPA: hypothetical protein VGF68_19170 [Solirubrobacteraceae bacterium]